MPFIKLDMKKTENVYHFFAFDIGATSGRSILATLSNDRIELEEITRFPNKIVKVFDKYYWDIYALFEEIKMSLKEVSKHNKKIDTIGIDTWGVDFVLVDTDGSILNQPRSYRDPHTLGIPNQVFAKIPKRSVYEITGIQTLDFNSLFQLFSLRKNKASILNIADTILFIPDALSYMLTGNKGCEYTIASTSQMLNARTKQFDHKLFEIIDLKTSVMSKIIMPGRINGLLFDEIAQECGVNKIPVVAVAGHDTASAIVAIPAENKNFAYLSSGTWSLMGIELQEPIITEEAYQMNFTNEGGADGTIRFLKNITGMWLLEQCKKEWENEGRAYSYTEIASMSKSVKGFQFLIDPDDPLFANPNSMTGAIIKYCKKTKQKYPESDADFVRCIFDSLALKYRYVLECLQKLAPFPIERLHVIGGGSKNELLNQATANSTNLPVIAGPSEATALGNVLLQAKGIGLVGSLQDMRQIVRNSVNTVVFLPKDVELWNQAYSKFLKYTQLLNINQKSKAI